jgi:septal ring factor EnvC (AmiA/AmiB activator)
MGLSVPSCPGQQEMQQNVEALKASETELKVKMTAADASIKGLKEDVAQMKTLLAQVSNTVIEQKGAIEKLNESLTALQSSKSAGAKAKGGKKK